MKTILDYADLVKEQHALNTTIAPVETDLTSASKAYAVGQKFIHDGVLYQAKTAIAQGAALVLNTNYEAADDVSSEIQTLANQADDIVNVLSAKNLWSETIPPTVNSGGSYTLANHEYVVSTAASTNSGVYWSTDKLLPFYADMVGVSVKVSFEVKADAPMSAYVGFYNNEVDLTTNYQKIEQNIADLSQIASAFKVYTRDTTSAHTIFMKNVMIRPASITSDDYVPYAMTNRELTEVAQQIESGYIIKTDKTKSLISVTADGVKTYGTLFSELRTALLTYLANHTDEYCEMLGVDTGAGLLPISPNSNALGKLYHSGDTLSIRFYGFTFADDGINIRSIEVYSGSASYKRYFISQSQYTATDSTDSIASSGTVLALHIRIYTKVS